VGGTKLLLRPASGKSRGKATTIKLHLSAANARKLAVLLAQGKRARATIFVFATDRAGNEGGARKSVSVRG
jgi:hypothetical protein